MRPPAFKYLAYSGLDCNATATGASSSSTSMPEDQQNQTTFSIEEDAIMSEGIRVMLEHMNFFLLFHQLPVLIIIFPVYLCSRQITELGPETRNCNSFKVLVSFRDLRTAIEFHKTLSYAKSD